MVTVLGHRGYLGAVVARRWAELGETGDYVICTFDDLDLIRRLARTGAGVIVPSTDAIAEDTPYAERKRAIEALEGITVIRSGIVDIRKQPRIGYLDWWCNPLTPLEWAELAFEKRDQPGLHVAGREPYSRHHVAAIVASMWGGIDPVPMTGQPLDRRQPQDRPRPPLSDAVRAFREWLG